jgi:hypothetical protein
MPQRGALSRSDEGLISQFVVLPRNNVERPRDWWRLCTGRPGVIKQRTKPTNVPTNRPKLRTQSGPICREQYVAPTREQRVALCE